MPRYLVFGSGAIGTLLGGLLAAAGHEVVFIGREWNVEGIRETGIRIRGIWGEKTTGPQPAYQAVEDIPQTENSFDQVLLCVKAFDTETAIQSCLPAIQDSTWVLSFQNGYGNAQTIEKYVGSHRTLAARVITGVELPEPGAVNVTVHADSIRLGHYTNQFPFQHIESIALTMKEAGIRIEATKEVEQYIWAKILYNSALNPAGALLRVNYGALGEHPGTREIMNGIVKEAFAVTSAHGIHQFWDSAEAYLQAFYNQMLPPTAAHFPSMLRDIEKGRRTEIDALNGAICTLGKKKNIPTPVNQTVTDFLHFLEPTSP